MNKRIETLLLGDSNDDEFVNVTDLVATINYILGRPSDKFNKTAADISKNHVVDIFDVNLGLGLIKDGTRGARMMTRAAAAANDKMTIKDLSIADAFYFLVSPAAQLLQSDVLIVYLSEVLGNFVGCNLYRWILFFKPEDIAK